MDGLLVRTVSEWFIYQEWTGQPGVQISATAGKRGGSSTRSLRVRKTLWGHAKSHDSVIKG